MLFRVMSKFHRSDPLKAKTNLNCTLTSSPYRAVNTLHFGYKNQSVNVV